MFSPGSKNRIVEQCIKDELLKNFIVLVSLYWHIRTELGLTWILYFSCFSGQDRLGPLLPASDDHAHALHQGAPDQPEK